MVIKVDKILGKVREKDGVGLGTGSVTTVSVATANGISGTVANPTTTPAITLALGVITPTSVNGLTLVSATNGFTIAGGTTPYTLTVPLTASVSGTNTGDQTLSSLGAQATLNGTGFVKATGTTISYDNSTYLTSLTGAVLTSQVTGQTIGDTTNRLTKLWATDITCTNAITGSVTGNAGTVTNATLTTALTVNTGTLTLTANAANNSVLTIGAGASSVSGINTGDNAINTSCLSLDQTTHQHIINGRPVLDQGLVLGTSPTVGGFEEGKIYYDNVFKTISANIDTDVNLQIGQEELEYVYNNTAATIYNGYAVYVTGVYNGGTNDVPTIAKAQSNALSTSDVAGICTQDLAAGAYGFITKRGNINDIDTLSIGAAWVITQNIIFALKIGGVAGNSNTVEVIDTTTGGLSYTEAGTTLVIDLGGTTPTVAQVVTEIMTTNPSTKYRCAAVGAGNIIVSGAVIFDNGVDITEGDKLYLSPTVAGMYDNFIPTAPNLEVRVARLLTKSATVGRIYVDIQRSYALTDLTDVTINNPQTDDILKYNGNEFINAPGGAISAGVGIEFYNCTPVIKTRTAPAGLSQDGTAGNGIRGASLSKSPVTTAEQTQTGINNGDTRPFASWLYDTALSRTTIDAGNWEFTTYASVSSTAGTPQLIRAIYQVVPGTGTVAFSGTNNNNRTVTITGGTPFTGTYFAANATNTVASWIQCTDGTDKGMYQITANASTSEATVTVKTGYTNETGRAYNIWNLLFTSNTLLTSTTAIQYNTSIVQPAYTVAATDKLGGLMFITSTSNAKTVTIYYNGTARSTHFQTPLVTLHNNLAGLDGGEASYRGHITSAQATILGNTSGTNSGDNASNSSSVPTGRNITINGTTQDLSTDRTWTITAGDNSLAMIAM